MKSPETCCSNQIHCPHWSHCGGLCVFVWYLFFSSDTDAHSVSGSSPICFNAQDPSVAMSVEQAIYEQQEQLQRFICRPPGNVSRIDCSPQYNRYEAARLVGGAKDLNARPVRKEERARAGELGRIW